MFEYEIKRFTRRCCKTDQEFKPGDIYYSVLIAEREQFVRLDFASTAWEGSPPGAIGWWRCQVAALNPNRAYWAPARVMLDYFGKLAESPEQRELYYLMALVLMRKKLLQLVENRRTDEGDSEMVVHAIRTKQDYTVPVCNLPAERLQQLQLQLCDQLFTDQPMEAADSEPIEPAETSG